MKYNIVISPTSDTYAVVLRCYTINEEGEQILIDRNKQTSFPNISAAMAEVNEFVKRNTED
jgi:hypothetical protein